MGKRHGSDSDLVPVEYESLLRMMLGGQMLRMKGIKGPQLAAVERHLHMAFSALPAGEEAVKHEFDMTRRLVKLAHEILPVTIAVGTDETIELPPDHKRTV